MNPNILPWRDELTLIFLTNICNVYNFVDDEAASNKENIDPSETDD